MLPDILDDAQSRPTEGNVDDQAAWSIENLKSSCVDLDYFRRLNGTEWPTDRSFGLGIGNFLNGRSGSCPGGKVDRYGFEQFLRSQKLAPRNDLAARLGMTPESLDQLIPRLPELGLSKKYEVYEGIYQAGLGDDLTNILPGFRFRTFGSHDFFCEFLHAKIGEALGLKIQPMYCRTSERIGDQRMFASTWDNILLEPLSVKHSVWLDFGKPLSLAPDRCSKLFYAEHHEEMKPYLAGQEEPRDLDHYLYLASSPRPA